ncbi:ATM interactor [Clarias gariepinus]|uniref:ATM interactor n=1 Tax=Clarias gariepinus TaxID=13013 RepID=UPI00234DE525|nr:ATM interactor [Clarias gariepinus]
MAATAAGESAGCSSTNTTTTSAEQKEIPPLAQAQGREIIKPSVTELTKVRTNILCTVQGCGKILPNTPALNMHLVKSHRVKEGIVNPTIRKDLKGSQKLYCCPIDGCPRGPNRPFSQFALVKQHFMKMHAEKKHKCVKCSNGYSTEWDLKRHAEDCGRTYSCTCGCPYASRTSLLSHIYRTGHEVPKEHRYPPVKKRKMEKLSRSSTKLEPNGQTFETDVTEGAIPAEGASHTPDLPQNNPVRSKNLQKLLLPMPKMALVNVSVMQLAHFPVLLPPTESGGLRSVVLTVDAQGSVSSLQLMPQSLGAVVPPLNTKNLKEPMPVSKSNLDAISTGIQVNLESLDSVSEAVNDLGSKNKSTSTNIQTDISFLSKGGNTGSTGEASVSSGTQTDISVSAQIQLPVSVQTQTFPLRSKATSSIGAQTETFSQIPFPSGNTTRETQTSRSLAVPVNKTQMDQAIMCANLFSSDMLSVSTQTTEHGGPFGTKDPDPIGTESGFFEDKTASSLCFGAQRDILHQNTVADNQTQTMNLFSDLENILSYSMAASGAQGCGSGLGAVQEQHTGIDFDFEDFLNATHIQTQTDESALGGLTSETPLALLDIETQTDFLLLDGLGDGASSDVGTRVQTSDLELEMFDTQTQTDLNFLLDPSSHVSFGSILRHSSFNMSTESSDTETQTDTRGPPPSSSPPLSCPNDGQIRLSSTETQTVSSSSSLGHLFLTSNETQTVMDDFLLADLAWNVESHFSSVETQTCEDFLSLFQNSDKAIG